MYGIYMLRHEEMKLTIGQSVQEKLLYHVTTESRALKSLNSGLDWRRNKLDCGVSFSDDADYANFYDNNPLNEETRVIMICTVLVSETYVFSKNIKGNTLNVPPDRADTTIGNHGRVYVKYNDNDFYPLYFVYYRKRPEHMTESKYSRAKTRRAMGHFDGLTLKEWCSDYLDYTTGYFDDDDDDDDSLEERYGDYFHRKLLRRRQRRRRRQTAAD